MADLIDEALAPLLKRRPDTLVRLHSTGGDFFSKEYFKAWSIVCRRHPGRQKSMHGMPAPEGLIVYSYTKATPFLLLDRPDNLRLVASRGGTRDDLIDLHGLRECRVCLSEAEARERKLGCTPLDDSHAWAGTKSFAVIIHGTQKAGSAAGRAISANRRAGRFAGYGRKSKKTKAAKAA